MHNKDTSMLIMVFNEKTFPTSYFCCWKKKFKKIIYIIQQYFKLLY